jgi:hypothetical protein
MNSAIFTNASLLSYYNMTHGTSLTVLNLAQLMSMGVHVKCVDVYPQQGLGVNAIHLTDGYVDIVANGINYTSFPDFINDSFPTFTEQKDISNDSINFKISNVNASFRTLALGGAFKAAQVNIYLTILNPANNAVLVHDLIFSGYIDYFESTSNNSAENIQNELTVNLNSVWKKLDVQMKTTAANSVHQSTHPNDAYFSLLGIVNSGQAWKYK